MHGWEHRFFALGCSPEASERRRPHYPRHAEWDTLGFGIAMQDFPNRWRNGGDNVAGCESPVTTERAKPFAPSASIRIKWPLLVGRSAKQSPNAGVVYVNTPNVFLLAGCTAPPDLPKICATTPAGGPPSWLACRHGTVEATPEVADRRSHSQLRRLRCVHPLDCRCDASSDGR